MAHEEYIRIVPGSRYAVLMLHGICGTPDHFREFIPLIPADWSAHSLLLDGHGGSVEDFAASSMKKWKAQVFSRLDELLATHEQVVILAHSMGTLFAMQAAIRYPDRIPHLFLLGSPLRVYVAPAVAINSVKLSFGILDESDRSAVDMQRGLSIRVDPWLHKYIFWVPRFWELLQEVGKARKRLSQITVPTQVFQSRHDELVLFSSRHDFEGYPMIHCTALPDSGHFGYGEKDLALLKDRFREMIRQVEA